MLEGVSQTDIIIDIPEIPVRKIRPKVSFINLPGIAAKRERIAEPEPHVQPEDEIGKIQTNAKPGSQGDLSVKRCDVGPADIIARVVGGSQEELGAAAVRIVLKGPDVATVQEKGPLQQPEDVEAIFQTKFEFYVAGLVKQQTVRDGVDVEGDILIAAGPQASGRPSSDAAGATHVELFDIRHIAGKTKRQSQAHRRTGGKGVFRIELPIIPEIEFSLDILRKIGAPDSEGDRLRSQGII